MKLKSVEKLLVIAALTCCIKSHQDPKHDPIIQPPTKQPPPMTSTDASPDIQKGPYVGMATHFSALGQPTGGCGVAEAQIDSQNFVALNVQHTPNDYQSQLPRPIPQANAAVLGEWNNGRNCGRWVMVTIGDHCLGINDGALGKPFCHDHQEPVWEVDQFNGASLAMIVADSCQDQNAWCRDDRYHLDLATASLSRFTKNNLAVGPLLPDHWGNRKISWQYIKAPNYQGDLLLGFGANAQKYYLPIILTHLENGIHDVEAKVNGSWQKATMQGDNGQSYVLPAGATSPYQIRIYDAQDQLIGNGRVYEFSFPSTCGDKCTAIYTPVTYKVVN